MAVALNMCRVVVRHRSLARGNRSDRNIDPRITTVVLRVRVVFPFSIHSLDRFRFAVNNCNVCGKFAVLGRDLWIHCLWTGHPKSRVRRWRCNCAVANYAGGRTCATFGRFDIFLSNFGAIAI